MIKDYEKFIIYKFSFAEWGDGDWVGGIDGEIERYIKKPDYNSPFIILLSLFLINNPPNELDIN